MWPRFMSDVVHHSISSRLRLSVDRLRPLYDDSLYSSFGWGKKADNPGALRRLVDHDMAIHRRRHGDEGGSARLSHGPDRMTLDTRNVCFPDPGPLLPLAASCLMGD